MSIHRPRAATEHVRMVGSASQSLGKNLMKGNLTPEPPPGTTSVP